MSDRREYEPLAPRSTPRPPLPADVRLAVDADVDDAAALSLTVAHGPVEQWQQRLARDVADDDRALVVARVDSTLVGYARVGHVVPGPHDTAPLGWYLTGLVVAQPWRRHGVGEALVLAVCEFAASQAEVLWSTYDDDNDASAALHASLGFRVVWRGDIGFPGQPPGSRWVLVQRLLTRPAH